MLIDLGLFRFELGDAEPVVPALLSMVSVADQQDKLEAGPTLAKSKPVTQRRSFSVAVSLAKEGEAPEKALERTLGEVVKRSAQAQVRAQDARTFRGAPAKLVELAHKQGQTALRSLVFIGFVDQWVVTALHTGLDLKSNEKAMRAQMDTFMASLRGPKG